MARDFVRASSEGLYRNSAPVSDFPILMSAWLYPDDDSNYQAIVSVHDSDAAPTVALFVWNDGTVGAYVQDGSGKTTVANTTSGITTGQYQHVAGLFWSDTDRRAFLDGANEGTDSTDRSVSGLAEVSIGWRSAATGFYLDGAVAEAAIWDLTGYDETWVIDNMIPALAKGWVPKQFPVGLACYWPLGGFAGRHDRDVWGGYDLSTTGSPTWADHPGTIIYPSAATWLPAAGAATTTITPWHLLTGQAA
mgnify:CR=1 FL=1